MATPDDAMEGLSACECPVCFNFLSETLSPMSMPCGHTLCSQCVDQLVSKATTVKSSLGRETTPTFRCPLCREWVNRDAVHLNVTLRDLIAQLTSIGVNPGSPESHQARVLSSLHVDYSEIEMGPSLDRGAFGEVFRGGWRGNDIAVKMFSSGILTPEAMQAFQREVFVMNCLRHPNVVLLMGACQTPPKLAILMEFVSGGSLHKLIYVDKVKLNLDCTCSLGSDICRGLQYLHSINILHRDLKSKNVLLSGPPPNGQAKLCDFGLARMRLESATLTGNVGTVHWSAPEVLSNSRYKFSADVYSLGMVLYEMSCGRIPFHSMVPIAVMMAVAVRREKPVIADNVHPTMATIITDCISWNPNERPSVGGVLSSLQSLIPHTPTPTQERRAHLTHSDSLGVVFVSVSDSNDLIDGGQLKDIAKGMGLLQPPSDNIERSVSEEDRSLAWQLVLEEKESMLARDQELAHQLQLRENAYLSPSDSQSSKVMPPKSVLDSIKKMTKSSKSSVTSEPEPVAKTKKAVNKSMTKGATKSSVPKTTEYAQTKSVKGKSLAPTEYAQTKSVKGKSLAPTEHAQTKSVNSKSLAPTEHAQTKSVKGKSLAPTEHAQTKSVKSKSLAPTAHAQAKSVKGKSLAPTEHAQTKSVKGKSLLSTQTSSVKGSHIASTEHAQTKQGLWGKTGAMLGLTKKMKYSNPPAPPPTPPLPSSHPPPAPPPPPLTTHTKSKFYSLPSAGRVMSSKRRLLNEVRKSGKRVAQRLRQVETVEKRAFRVGRVVDGYSSERSQYTVQNQIRSFNHRLLHHISIQEPPPPFPVGKVLYPKSKGQNVKRMSSLIEAMYKDEATPTLLKTTPTRKLHPSIRKGIVAFRASSLHPVSTTIKYHLPTSEDIIHERELVAMETSAIDQSDFLKLNPVIQTDIVTYDHRRLHPVQTIVKQSLPTSEHIATEKSDLSQQDQQSADSASSNDQEKLLLEPASDEISQDNEQLVLEKEKLQGFW